ncbi:hypothetical protein GALMADRAFT_142024 [Galerina marginata CBS 339.88]|uniref:Uncharacterized protein n=1 Tax=Galerina marginata (strain CBS 339.88) TaxID=685588 RepID=A0A067SRP9_GALM3|nr:hypothetical protein GALMADRAFT_142024 [Galerina marginata CBS 339.88]
MPTAGPSQASRGAKAIMGEHLFSMLIDKTTLPEVKALCQEVARILITHDRLAIEKAEKENEGIRARIALVEAEKERMTLETARLEAELKVMLARGELAKGASMNMIVDAE